MQNLAVTSYALAPYRSLQQPGDLLPRLHQEVLQQGKEILDLVPVPLPAPLQTHQQGESRLAVCPAPVVLLTGLHHPGGRDLTLQLPLLAQDLLQQDVVILTGLHHPRRRELPLLAQHILLAGLHHLGGRELHLLPCPSATASARSPSPLIMKVGILWLFRINEEMCLYCDIYRGLFRRIIWRNSS